VTTIISKDIQSLIQADKINDSYTVKRKLLWGPDGTGNDIQESTPPPVGLMGPFVPPVHADSLTASYPDTVTEVYQYYQATTLLSTITVVYSDSTKSQLVSVTKT